MSRVFVLIGTKAELIKLFPVINALVVLGLHPEIIATGQNDIENDHIWGALCNAKVDYKLSKRTPVAQNIFAFGWWFFSTLISSVLNIKKKLELLGGGHILLVHGDTVSTLLGAVLGKVSGMCVAHVEAGLRSFDYLSPFPEEINRVLVSKIAKVHFCQNDWSAQNLRHNSGLVVNTGGNTLCDSVNLAVTGCAPAAEYIPYFILILHRQENLYNGKFIETLLNILSEFQASSALRCKFIMHPLTAARLSRLGLMEKVHAIQNVEILQRQEFAAFVPILAHAEFLVTDGGSNQEECYYLGLPCLLLRTKTERVEGLGENIVLGKNQPELIKKFLFSYKSYKREKAFPRVSPSQIIAEKIGGLQREQY